jgi:tetratricopeptide (TPR) repeat protein
MKAGWALQKQSKWADSVPEFEAALKAIPGDQHALGELGWSAMNAGDFKKARKADNEAIQAAIDPVVKAQGLFNLGVVQEKSGDKDGALKSFLASLQLRPNKTVEAEVGKLGASPAAKPAWCAAGQKPCDCVEMEAMGDTSPDYQCAEVTDPAPPVKGWHVYHMSEMGLTHDYLLDEKNQLVAEIAEDFEHGHHEESVSLEKAEVKTIGGHQVLRLETSEEEESNFTNFDEKDQEVEDDEDLTGKYATICVVGDAKTPTSCPLQHVMLSATDDHDVVTDLEAPEPKHKDTKTERATDVSIADDGTVTVKLVKGSSDPQLDGVMGPHKLW